MLALLFAYLQSTPPTDDPTFGMHLPLKRQSQTKLPQDADWIWTRETKDNQTVYFRKSFNLEKAPRDANLYITADNTFDVFVNGREIGHTDPDKGSDEGWRTIHRYPLVNLTSGPNSIAVVAFNQSGAAGLLARIEVDDKPVVLSDWTWRESETEPLSDWKSPRYRDAGWTGALKIQPIGGDPWGSGITGWPAPLSNAAPYLCHLALKPVRYAVVQKPGTIEGITWSDEDGKLRSHGYDWQSTDGDLHLSQPIPGEAWQVVVDFGKELDGRIRVDSKDPVQVTIGTGEDFSESIVRPWTTNTLDVIPGKPSYTIYTALDSAALTFPANQTKADFVVSMDHLYYPVQYRGSFDCSDPRLTKIWYTGAYTAHSCMQEDIWDAPKRDRMRWMGDLHVSGEVINDVFLDRFLMEQTLTRLRKDAQGGKADSDVPSAHVNGIPGYSCAWIAGLCDFYNHTGDLAYLKKQHDLLISMLDYFRGELDENGLFADARKQWPFVDWSPGFDKDSQNDRIATHCFMTLAAKDGAYLLNEMGDKTAAAKYSSWSNKLAEAARTSMVGADGAYGDRRQENAMAIYSGVATPDQVKAIWANVLQPGLPSWSEVATPYYDNYVIFAMSMSGHTKEALDFVRSFWGDMIEEGATTFWEAYDPKWKKDNFHVHLNADDAEGYFVSLCHGWSAGCTSFLTERVLGVRSTGAGFATCEIKPELCGLSWASGVVPTPHGPIRVKVRKEGGKIHLSLDIPKGVRAKVTPTDHSQMVPLEHGHSEIEVAFDAS